jgi:hypothetical protein
VGILKWLVGQKRGDQFFSEKILRLEITPLNNHPGFPYWPCSKGQACRQESSRLGGFVWKFLFAGIFLGFAVPFFLAGGTALRA